MISEIPFLCFIRLVIRIKMTIHPPTRLSTSCDLRDARYERGIRILHFVDYISSTAYGMVLFAILIHYTHPTHSLKVSFPTFQKNLAVISNIDVKRANEFDKGELAKLF